MADQDDDVFRYNDGRADRFGDPVLIARRFTEAMGDMTEKQIADAFAPDAPYRTEEQLLALTDRFVAAIRAALKMEPFDENTGQGLTQTATIKLWNRFLAWTQEHAPPVQDVPPPSLPPPNAAGEAA